MRGDLLSRPGHVLMIDENPHKKQQDKDYLNEKPEGADVSGFLPCPGGQRHYPKANDDYCCGHNCIVDPVLGQIRLGYWRNVRISRRIGHVGVQPVAHMTINGENIPVSSHVEALSNGKIASQVVSQSPPVYPRVVGSGKRYSDADIVLWRADSTHDCD